MPRKKGDSRTTKQRRQVFLTCYSETCNILRAAKKARITRCLHYEWLKDAEYAKTFALYKKLAGEYMEAMAVERAAEGWLEPIHYQGKKCGTVRRYDGGLMQFLLRGLMPEKYGARAEVGSAEAPVQAKIEVVFVRPDDTNTDRQ
jgi:hypothetical protein